jgi:uncharacterized protein (DUF1697 family)
MALSVALLRGINIAGHNKVAMADLRRLCEDIGLRDPRSLLNSGNLLFESGKRSTAQLERLLETEARKRLALETEFFVRTGKEWEAVIADNPFTQQARRDPGHLVVMILKDAVGPKEVGSLQKAIAGPELVRGRGRHVYVTYPAGIGRSRLTSAVIDAKLGTRGTGRNWNTVLKIGTIVRS